MDKRKTYDHWKLSEDKDNILWMTIDRKDSSVNSLNAEVLTEFDEILTNIPDHDNCVGVIISSGKSNGFIAGADIEQFTKLRSIDDATHLIRHAQIILDKLEALHIPSVAMIDGFCLGGGLELALACTYRVAEEGRKTRLGLPEVKLGIHPGWGGYRTIASVSGCTASDESDFNWLDG